MVGVLFRAVKPGDKVRLGRIDPGYRGDHENADKAADAIAHYKQKLGEHQSVLYAEKRHSVLIVLQALDAAGKDGTVNHVLAAFNPQGAHVAGFKQPTPEERAHDFLWRVHPHAPGRGEIAIFNRSHYEDVLVTRVHKLIDKDTWTTRYRRINEFETLLAENDTTILKFFLHIDREQQLARFAERLEDPARNWKISESDYSERALGTTTSRLSRMPWRRPAPSTRRGTSSRRTTSGSATSRCRKSWPTRCTTWA
jgi:PPK2 family polyphosphate:nucleotide phosphotransferase